jgi:molecular chaperone Hsp33
LGLRDMRAYMTQHRNVPRTNIMTLTTRIAWDDTVLPFQLDRSDIRGRVARLDTTLEQILEQHDYPPEVEALVAEMALLTAMIGQTIKLRWKLSLQVRGDGPIRLIATDFFAPGEDGAPARIRAFASYDADRLEFDRASIRSRRPARAISRS